MNKFWTVVAVLVVIAGGVWWFSGQSGTSLYPQTSVSPVAVATYTPTATKAKATATATPVATPVLSYSQLVAKYGVNRIQFDANCQAQPKSVVFKNPTTILLDNRANQARTIGLNGTTYNLGAYGYQVVTLSNPTGVSQKLTLSCNKLVNVGTIQLEANISGQ